MSSAGISFGGLSSGLDTRAIISALMAVERRPITALETKKATFQRQKDLFGTFGGLLTTLKDKARILKGTTDFLAMSSTVDKDQYLTASATPSAQPGSHRIKVLSLAASQVSHTNGRADRDATQFGDSTLEITIGGNSHFVSVGSGTGFASTLDGIAGAINAQDLGVRAEVVNTGSATNPYQLVVRGSTTGSTGAFSIAVDSGPASMTTLIGEFVGANTPTQATDARINLDGIVLTRSSNTISDAIAGVTLDLRALSVNLLANPPLDDTATLTIATDATATATKVKEFVDAYNAVVDFMSEQNQLDSTGKAKGPLFGDTTLRSVRSQLRTIAGTSVDTGNEAYRLLSQAGITSDTAGKLTFNQSRFEEALSADPDAVSALFNKATTGIANRVYDQVSSYNDTVNGLLKARSDGFTSLIKQAQGRIDAAERRLTQYQKSLEQRFSAMETMMSRLQGQGSSLSSINRLSQ